MGREGLTIYESVSLRRYGGIVCKAGSDEVIVTYLIFNSELSGHECQQTRESDYNMDDLSHVIVNKSQLSTSMRRTFTFRFQIGVGMVDARKAHRFPVKSLEAVLSGRLGCGAYFRLCDHDHQTMIHVTS